MVAGDGSGAGALFGGRTGEVGEAVGRGRRALSGEGGAASNLDDQVHTLSGKLPPWNLSRHDTFFPRLSSAVAPAQRAPRRGAELLRGGTLMRLTLSVIKADIGSVGGHTKPSARMMATVE